MGEIVKVWVWDYVLTGHSILNTIWLVGKCHLTWRWQLLSLDATFLGCSNVCDLLIRITLLFISTITRGSSASDWGWDTPQHISNNDLILNWFPWCPFILMVFSKLLGLSPQDLWTRLALFSFVMFILLAHRSITTPPPPQSSFGLFTIF